MGVDEAQIWFIGVKLDKKYERIANEIWDDKIDPLEILDDPHGSSYLYLGKSIRRVEELSGDDWPWETYEGYKAQMKRYKKEFKEIEEEIRDQALIPESEIKMDMFCVKHYY